MVTTRMFIIPWFWASFAIAQNTQSTVNTAFAGPTFYDFIQRQNQLNNALLLNNALITNSMATNSHLQHNMGLYPSFGNIPNHLTEHLHPSHLDFLTQQAILNRDHERKLGIYDLLNGGKDIKSTGTRRLAVMGVPIASPTHGHLRTDEEAVENSVENENEKKEALFPDAIHIHSIEESREELRDEEKERKGESVEEEEEDIPEVFNLLKHLNLTEEERDHLVHHVEQVVREELAARMHETTSPSTAPNLETIVVPSSARRNPASPSKVFDQRPEIKLHPPRRVEQEEEFHQNFAIKTSETHIPVVERIPDEEGTEKKTHVDAEVGSKRSATPSLRVVTSSETEAPPTRPPTPQMNIHSRQPVAVRDIPDNDSDLLELVTGAPLDLSGEGRVEKVVENTKSIQRTTAIPRRPVTAVHAEQTRRRLTTQQTKFNRLANDYRNRLTGTGDVNKIMRKLYENAYIQLSSSNVAPQRQTAQDSRRRAPHRRQVARV